MPSKNIPQFGWYVPVPQGRQTVLTDCDTVPGQHSVQSPSAGIPTPETYLPAAHSVQLAATGIPLPVWYFPAPHRVQLASNTIPVPVWYLPLPQSAHPPTEEEAPDALP